MCFPKNKKPDDISLRVIQAFQKVENGIGSATHKKQTSDEALAKIRPGLEACGFHVEKSKRKEERIPVPILFGINGKIEKSFEADAYDPNTGYMVEVEAGPVPQGFFEACTMNGAETLCIAVRNDYRSSDVFSKVCTFFDSLYAGSRLEVPLSGLLIVGY